MKLYSFPMSSCSRRVHLTAELLGTQLERHPIDLRVPADRAVLVSVNPNNKVPVLVDEAHDLVLWESHAIMAYLCDRSGAAGAALYPTELAARADVLRWMFWVNAHLAPPVGGINFERLWKRFIEPANPEPDAGQLARHEKFFHQAMAVLDQHLATRTWVSGKALTLADLSISATLMYRVPTRLPLDGYAQVLALLGRVSELPAWQATEPPKAG